MTHIKIFTAGLLNYAWNDVVTHIPLHFLRKAFLRLFNRNISSSSVILLHTRILNFWNVVIGDRSVINQHVLLDCRRFKIIIDSDVDIGPYTKIWTLGHLPDSGTHEVSGGDVVLRDHVWVASDVTVLPGVLIGKGAVVGASSVVTKDVPDMEIWAGVPARFVRSRDNDLSYVLNYVPYFE